MISRLLDVYYGFVPAPLRAFFKRISPSRLVTYVQRLKRTTPEEVFWGFHHQRFDQRRLEHLASLDLDITGSTVLEIGGGAGNLTSFFIDRGCAVTEAEPREGNLKVIRARYPMIKTFRLDLDDPDPNFNEVRDIVFCYGVLYHLKDPARALKLMSKWCRKTLLLDTAVDPGTTDAIRFIDEDPNYPSYAVTGVGCFPTRTWVYNRLKESFKYVYMPTTQPYHEEFPLDWNAISSPACADERRGPRAIFVASHVPLNSKSLVEAVPMVQRGH